MSNEMPPELLAHLSPEQREAWEHYQSHVVNAMTSREQREVEAIRAATHLPAALLELAQTKQALVEAKAETVQCESDYQSYINTIRLNVPEQYRKQPQLDLCMQRMKEALAELRAVVESAPCSDGCVSDQFGHADWCWKSRLPKPNPLTPSDRVALALRGRDKADAERVLDKMYPKPEADTATALTAKVFDSLLAAKPEEPKCKQCSDNGFPDGGCESCGLCSGPAIGRAQ